MRDARSAQQCGYGAQPPPHSLAAGARSKRKQQQCSSAAIALPPWRVYFRDIPFVFHLNPACILYCLTSYRLTVSLVSRYVPVPCICVYLLYLAIAILQQIHCMLPLYPTFFSCIRTYPAYRARCLLYPVSRIPLYLTVSYRLSPSRKRAMARNTLQEPGGERAFYRQSKQKINKINCVGVVAAPVFILRRAIMICMFNLGIFRFMCVCVYACIFERSRVSCCVLRVSHCLREMPTTDCPLVVAPPVSPGLRPYSSRTSRLASMRIS